VEQNRTISSDERRAPADGRSADTFLSWWRAQIARTIDHSEVLQRVEEDARWSGHYLFMILISAGIAVFGLLLSSPAVVIGAMLISPLMGPILGLGFGIALFDTQRIGSALATLLAGILLAVLFCAAITLVSPLQTVTPEIAARTRPNLFDLGVAMLSGAGGTYAMIRGRHGAIVGVAIAVAVMPPLAAVGFGLASGNRSIVLGAAFLFLTNLTAISLTAAVLARVFNFGHQLSPRHSWLQGGLIVAGLVALAVPLGLALRQIGWEGVASRNVRDALMAEFGDGARVSATDIDFDRNPIEIDAVVFTPKDVVGAEQHLANRLARDLGQQVVLSVEQVRLGGDEAEASELAAARGSQPDRQADQVAERLGLAAGRAPVDVLIDRVRRVARVQAAPLPGANFAAYQALEKRVADASSGWTVLLVPPLLELPILDRQEGADGTTGWNPGQIATVAWAGTRLNLPVTLSGAEAEELAAELRRRGVDATVAGTRGRVQLDWRAPSTSE
jgi:uncharacterized hydrophobic protein (TIGR00271 family)